MVSQRETTLVPCVKSTTRKLGTDKLTTGSKHANQRLKRRKWHGSDSPSQLTPTSTCPMLLFQDFRLSSEINFVLYLYRAHEIKMLPIIPNGKAFVPKRISYASSLEMYKNLQLTWAPRCRRFSSRVASKRNNGRQQTFELCWCKTLFHDHSRHCIISRSFKFLSPKRPIREIIDCRLTVRRTSYH